MVSHLPGSAVSDSTELTKLWLYPDQTMRTTVHLAFGPRLLRAKALFGETIRTCKNEFVAYAKEIPPEKLRHVLVMVCTQYHKCRSLITTEEFRTSSSHYMHLNFTKEYVNAANNTLTCVLNHISNSTLNVQAVDDATAFALKAVVNFGWTK
ncbi:hypothetical protein MRX96_033087 [Rhipicephalus microplus]